MALRLLLATAAVAAVGVGLILPAPHFARTAHRGPQSQIALLEVAR